MSECRRHEILIIIHRIQVDLIENLVGNCFDTSFENFSIWSGITFDTLPMYAKFIRMLITSRMRKTVKKIRFAI